MKSCIYAGVVRHRRYTPVEHFFNYRVFQMYLDLDELPHVLDSFWCWSARSAALAWFRREDHFGDPGRPLAECVRDEVEQATGHRPNGPIRVLTNLRYFGYVINPVSYYYCFDAADRVLQSVLAEVHNTPWGERHCYVVDEPIRPSTGAPITRWTDKQFHVSPFMQMNMRYRWRFSAPGKRLSVHLQNHACTDAITSHEQVSVSGQEACAKRPQAFDVTLHLLRQPLNAANLRRILLQYPFMTARVAFGIYWQALRLWMKRVPFVPHPARAASNGEPIPPPEKPPQDSADKQSAIAER